MMVLKDDADVAPDVGNLAVADVVQINPVEKNLPARRSLDHRNQFQQGTFAGTGMPGKKCHLPLRQPQVDLAERIVAAGVAFADVVEVNHWRCCATNEK